MPNADETARYANRASDGLWYSNRERTWRRNRGWWVSYDEAERFGVAGQPLREAVRVIPIRQAQAAERVAVGQERNVERVTNAPTNVEAEYEAGVAAGVAPAQPAHAVGLGRRRRRKGRGRVSTAEYKPAVMPLVGSGHKQSIQLGGIVMPENRPIGGILGRFIAY